MKTCVKCEIEKDDGEFVNKKTGTLNMKCRSCNDRLNAFNRKYRTQPDLVKRQRILDCNRNSALKGKYGITLEQYREQLKRQCGACAICKKTPKHTMVVDHCHRTNDVRGLLCHTCNRVLGLLHDSSEVLREAAMYLESTTYRMEKV